MAGHAEGCESVPATLTVELANDLPAQGCVAGAQTSGEGLFLWAPTGGEASQEWRFIIEALPGQQGLFRLLVVDWSSGAPVLGAELYRAPLGEADAILVTPSFRLSGSGYALGITGYGTLLYRLRVERTEGNPAEQLPVSGALGEFSGTTELIEDLLAYPWSLSEANSAQRWDLEFRHDLSGSATLRLLGDSFPAVYAHSQAGIARLSDLALPAGEYTIEVSGRNLGDGILSARATGSREPGREQEPNDVEAAAFPIDLEEGVTGRLIGTTSASDQDTFSLVIGEEWRDRRFDLVVRGPPGNPLRLSLLSQTGVPIAERADNGEVRLADLQLPLGRHDLRVAGALSQDEIYKLSIEEIAEADPGEEREPNDLVSFADTIGSDGVVRGRFVGEELDSYGVDVGAPLRLWTARVEGEAASRLELYDSAGGVLVRVDRRTAEGPLRLSSLLLVPGRHVFAVSGVDGDYELTLEPQAAVADLEASGAEVEPNDDIAHTLPLGWDVPRQGWLDREGDQDVHGFSLDGERRVQLTLHGPPGLETVARLVWGDPGTVVAQLTATAANEERAVWDGVLLAGDYYLTLATSAPSEQPYKLTLERLPYFSASPDREPNDLWHMAMDVPPDLRLGGHLEVGDIDWYRLPDLDRPAVLLMRDDAGAALAQAAYLQVGQEVTPLEPGTWRRDLQKVADFQPGDRPREWRAAVPAGSGLYLGVQGGYGRYDLELDFEEGPDAEARNAPLEIAFSETVPPLAAYVETAQVVRTNVVVRNGGDAPVETLLVAHVEDEAWDVAFEPNHVALAPHEERVVALVIRAPAELLPGRAVWVSATAAAGVPGAAAETPVEAQLGAAAVNPIQQGPLPEALLGNFNVAAAALGGRIQEPYRRLIDGLRTPGGVLSLSPEEITAEPPIIDLAGDTPVPLAGFILDPGGTGEPGTRLRQVAILTSTNGTDFREAIQVELSPLAVEQAFTLETPIEATHVRLQPIDDQLRGPTGYRIELAEIKAVAVRGQPPTLARQGMNLLAPEIGGHVVWSSIPLPGEAMLTSDPDATTLWIEEGGAAVEWVTGFRGNRAAQVTAISWLDREGTTAAERFARVSVWAATEGPLGPWSLLGEINLESGTGRLDLVDPVWVRHLRFVAETSAAPGSVWLPEQLSAIEHVSVASYASILGEWGDTERRAIYERLVVTPAVEAEGEREGDSRDAPRLLPEGTALSGAVLLEEDDDWFSIEVPEGQRRTVITLSGTGASAIAPHLETREGETVALEAIGGPGVAAYAADLAPGRHLLQLAEGPRSVAILWDTSGSVGPYRPAIAQAVHSLVRGVETGREEVNLIPFRAEGSEPLLATWSGNPLEIYPKLQAYPWQDASSNAEAALLVATQALALRQGTRAIIILTDAESDGAQLNPTLWEEMSRVMPRIFVIAVPTALEGPEAWRAQALMQDWAGLNGGGVYHLAGLGDVDTAFDRISALLRRPAAYTVRVGFEAPEEPGYLRVGFAPGAPPPVVEDAVEIILDASGSMLQRLEGERRIDVAKATLNRIVNEVLSPGVPFALRVFGEGPPESCETGLTLPLSPLDPAQASEVIGRIAPTNRARTPIAASLRLVAEDLEGAQDRRLVLLVTDGEETCGGDPGAEIAMLREAGVDVRINIVGFAIDDPELRRTFESWAAQGGGAFVEAQDGPGLSAAIEQALRPEFQVVDERGRVVAQGTVEGSEVEVMPGRYSLRLLGSTVAPGPEVEVREGQVSEVVLTSP